MNNQKSRDKRPSFLEEGGWRRIPLSEAERRKCKEFGQKEENGIVGGRSLDLVAYG